MPSYILVLRDNPTAGADLSPEEMQGIIQKYVDWTQRLREQERYTGGNKLKDDEGRVLRPGNGRPRVTDGPYSETKEVVGGFMILRAADYDEAVRLASDCPHLGFGGTIEVREVEEH